MDEEWGTNDPVVGENDSETWGENDLVVEDQQDDWGANDSVIGESANAPSAPSVLQQYDEVAKGYKERSAALQSASEKYKSLAESPERTPEQEVEMTNQWQSMIRSQAQLGDDASKLKDLQPAYDKYFADQKQARIDYIEDRRGSGIFGDEGANALYELDGRAEQEYEAARSITDDQKRKEAMASIQAKYSAEEKALNNQFVDRFKEGETKINNAADVIGQAFAKGQTVDQFLLETNADAEEYAELRDSLLNQDDPEKGRLYRESKAMYDLASGQTVVDGETIPSKVGIVNNEIRVSPLHVWDAEGIKAEINALDISDAKKQKTIASIPQLQEEAAKVELPFLQQVSEFNDFVKENNLENVSPKQQISQWKNRNEDWLDYVGKTFPQIGIGLTKGALGLLEAGQAIVGGTALTLGAQDFADPFLDSATKTSYEIQRLSRISQEIGGPTFAAELAAVVPQIVTQIGFGSAIGLGGSKLGLKPKTVSNIGFGSSVGMAFAQSYGGVLSSAFQQLEKEKIDGGMDPVQARAEAVKEAQLPAALSGLSTAIVTTLGGKRGAEGVFREGVDGIKAKLNTATFKGELDAFVPNIFKGVRNEGYEEFADQLAQGIIEQFSFNPELATSDIVNNAFKALVIGGITGGTVEGLKYGYDYMRAPSQMARREESMASMRQSISDVEKEISEAAASSPIGAEFQREYDVTQPSDMAANLGARSVDRNRMTTLQEERKQLTELLEDDGISRVARNQLEAKLAAADFSYYNEILVPSRINVVNEQIVDQLDALGVTQQTKDSVTALAKIANGLGAESLTGRERVAVGITSVGEGRFLPSKKNPMVEINEQGVATVTEAGRLMAENVGMVPLVRMIGLSETTQAKAAEMQRIAEEIAAQRAQTEAKEMAESEEAKRYGPASAEALKQQVEGQPPAGDGNTQAKIAQLLKEQEEAQRQALEALQKKEAPAEIPAVAEQAGVAAIAPPAVGEVTPPTEPAQPEARPTINPETLNPRGKQAVKILTSIGVDEETAALVASSYQDEAGEMGAEEWRDFVRSKFEENGGVIPAQMRYSEDPEYYQLAFNVAPEEAAQIVESAKAENQRMAQDELQQNKQWRRKDEQATQPQRGIAQAQPEAKAVPVAAGEVPPSPAIEGRRVPATAPKTAQVALPPAAPPAEPPVAAAPTQAPLAGALTEEQAQNFVKAAERERARKPPVDVKGKTKYGVNSVAPKVVIGKSARAALINVSRLNLSKIAQSDPNEIMMQDVAAILAELQMPILDSEEVVSLSSLGRKGRAGRFTLSDGRRVIAIPSTLKTPVELFVHEVGHTITADEIRKYAPRRFTQNRGRDYLDTLNKAINDTNTPEPIRKLFSLYISTIDQLGITEQYFGADGVAGSPKADTSRAMARRLQAQGTLRKDLNWVQLYGLANIEEFVSQTFAEPDFRELLKTLKDPTQPSRTLWTAFVEAIQKILQLPKGSMAAGVIEASVDIGMYTVPAKKAGVAAPSPATTAVADMAPEPEVREATQKHIDAAASNNVEEAQRLTDEVAKARNYNSENLLFHGTTHIFNVFKKDRANIENDFGKGYYLTNTEADAQTNYAGEGPDLTNRIERLAEQLQSNEDMDEDVAKEKAREILSGGGQRIMRVYVRLENPFNVGGPNETFLDYEAPYDETNEEYGEPTGALVDFLDQLRSIIERYSEDSAVDADKAVGNILEAAFDQGGISASDLVRILKQEDSGIMWASDENGDLASSEIIREAIEASGFDGIVDNLVNQKFGSQKRIGKAMAGMGADTVHTIVFNSSQIKSADAITRDDQGNVIPLSERFLAEEEDVRYAPEEEFEISPDQVEDQIDGTPEASTIKVMGAAFKLANEQSAAEGSTEGTLPLETITNAWMNSGRDTQTLEDAIIRYTNLSPEVATTLAEAISKQLDIQRGIAEISDMASKKRAEDEIEERAYSFARRVKEDLPPSVARKIETVYEVLRNDVSVQEANEVMRGLSLDEAIAATKDMENGVSMPVRSMMAQIVNRRLMDYRKNTKKSGRNEDYKASVEAHVDFFNWTNEYFKELGQGVQAISRFMDLGADGILRKLKKDTDKAITKNIKERKSKIDQIKKDVENGDNSAFNAAVNANKSNIDQAANNAAKQEAKKLTIEEQAQKLAQKAAKKVTGEVVRPRKADPLSELVNGHLRKYNKDFLADARAMGISQETAQKIDESAQKLRDSRVATKSEKERFDAMQEERMRVKRQLARENKYIYGERPTIWENYQSMFSDRLARRLMRDPQKKVPPSLLLFTDRLTENLLGFIPESERQASTPKSFQAMVEDALNNKEKYQEAFNKALRDISAKVEELETEASETEEGNAAYFQALAAEEFLQKLAPKIQDFPVSEKLVSRFVGQKTKNLGISLIAEYNRWYRSSRRDRGEIEAKLQQRLIADLNIPLADARRLSQSIIKDFREKADARRQKALERFKKPQEKSDPIKETPLKKFFELTNMGALTDQDAYEIMANRFDLPTWDQKFADKIYEMAQDIQDMDDGLQRRLMTQNLMVEIARQKGFNLADLGSGFIYANILSSPDTHMVNIVDTLINNFANAFADAVSIKDFSRLRGVVNGYRKGIFEAVEVMKTGRRINMPSFEEKAPLIAELVRFGKKGGVKLASKEGANSVAQSILESKPAKFLNAAKWVGRLLEAQDALNFSASVEGQRYAEAARIATEEGLKGRSKQKRIHEILNVGDGAYQKALQQAEAEGYMGTEAKFRAIEIQDEKIPADIKDRSFERGLRDVYRNMPVGVAGQLAATVNSAFEKIDNPWVRNALKLTVSPFIITPVNLFNKWLDWSPWGYKRLFMGTGGWYGVDSKYYVAPYAKGTPEWRAQLFKANSSVMVMGLLGGLIKAGIMTLNGRGPSDEEERKQWSDDGNKPYTFRFGNGPQISFVYSPWAVPLSVMANMVNWNKYNAKDDASYAYRLMASVSFVPAIVMELPFFQGAADLIDLFNMKSNTDMVKRFEKFAEGKTGMLFPNFLRYIDRLFDPQQYDSQGVKGIIIDQMPFARRLGGPKMNMFGEPIGEGKPLLDRLAGRFVAFPKPSRESRILAKYDAYPYMPNPRRAEALIDGEKAPMTEEQYSEFAIGVGQEFKKWLNSNYDPDAEVSEQALERGKKRISKRLSEIRARWVRKVSTY
jgi:hypothetical protein